MIQTLTNKLFADNNITVAALRLDLIHPDISGNKWFKLKYHLADALAQGKTGMVSFGGAYSNHLVAMAFACRASGLASAAIIRGEDVQMHNHSIARMQEYGMKLTFASRDAYRDKETLIRGYLSAHPDEYYVPEGGQSPLGIRGASEIVQNGCLDYSHVVCSVGTGTTIAGIINGSSPSQQTIGISALKVPDRGSNALLDFIGKNTEQKNYRLLFDYHFGGYAKKNMALIRFMNELHRTENIPTDFVYTGKLFFAVHELAAKKFFDEGSRVLVVHSGGLQGNRSLPTGLLDF